MKVYLKDKKTLVIEVDGKKTELSFKRREKSVLNKKLRLKIESKK